MYGCESWTYKESWALKNWCFWTLVLEKTLESPLDWKESQPVHPKGDQSWVFFGRNDAVAETPILWPPHAKSWLIGKDSDAGRDWGQEEKGMTEDEMAGWHHRFDGREFEWTPGVGDGQGGLACCSPWGHKESDMTERLNWTEHFLYLGKTEHGASHMAQWWRICLPMQETLFNPWSRKIPHATEQLSMWAATTESVRWSPGTTTTEHTHPGAMLHNRRSRFNEKLPHCSYRVAFAPYN